MADIRINSLSTTATSFNANDYIVIDGATGGTRKMLAANPPFTDVTLGSGGPSVKSSLDARAARQGLVFDGTGNASTFSGVTPSGDFSVAAIVNVTSFGSSGRVFLSGPSSPSLEFGVLTTGAPYIFNGTSTLSGTAGSIVTGKFVEVVYTKSGTTGTFYVNGVSAGTVTDSLTYGATSQIGGNNAISGMLGTIAFPLIYNRALSASEVVSLFEAGVPAGADYNTATNTAINTTTFTATAGYNTFSGASATGFTAGTTTAANAYASAAINGTRNTGAKFRVSFTISANTGFLPNFWFAISGGARNSAIYNCVAGSNSFETTLTAGGSIVAVFNNSETGIGAYTVSSISITPVGLLLAPDAYQAGGGLAWYDTSGNAANITLPASGVSWNVPSSQKTASGWTFGGSINATGTSTLTAGYWKTKPTADDGTLTGFSLANSGGTQVGVMDVNTLTGDIRVGGISTAYPLSLYSKNVAVLSFGASSAATLAGNLTVSGTGTSSVAGNWGIGTTTPSYLLHITGNGVGSGGTQIYVRDGNASGSNNSLGTITFSSSPGADYYIGKKTELTVGNLVFGNTNGTEYARIKDNGNLLLGTTIDGGNGKLQLATHTTSAGGIGFGTDTSLFRSAAGNLQISASVTSAALAINNVGSGVTALAYDATGALVYSTGSLRFQTNSGTTALTLDASQNASFAGTLQSINYAQVAVTSGDTIALCGNDGNNTYYLAVNYLNNRGTETIPRAVGRASWRWAFDDTDSTGNAILAKRSGGAAAGAFTNLLTIAQTGNATFAGTITPQQAATASAPSYVKGAIYFDTTLNKLRVGGATGWETITST